MTFCNPYQYSMGEVLVPSADIWPNMGCAIASNAGKTFRKMPVQGQKLYFQFTIAFFNDNTPFNDIVSKRWNCVISQSITHQSTTLLFQSILATEQESYLRALYTLNNRIVAGKENRTKVDASFLVRYGWLNYRPLEQALCKHSTLESIVGRAISDEEIDNDE
ncbi:hypothetical protein PMAYCL1PPCAC_20861 [Pristionchus mayeri]|uniref:Uncharacterized protein n=1 Tax=Pristionchus mayeri TaxID=1317129 RepID=A0AAN5CU40_9BILA|nr:hypothetical protein PMAYCL1PPCAC_20861 [Pristionchus mayeri]